MANFVTPSAAKMTEYAEKVTIELIQLANGISKPLQILLKILMVLLFQLPVTFK